MHGSLIRIQSDTDKLGAAIFRDNRYIVPMIKSARLGKMRKFYKWELRRG
jgi:hypothetical protein